MKLTVFQLPADDDILSEAIENGMLHVNVKGSKRVRSTSVLEVSSSSFLTPMTSWSSKPSLRVYLRDCSSASHANSFPASILATR